MLKIENVEVMGWEHAIRGMRNPKNSWDKSDTHMIPTDYIRGVDIADKIGPNDQKLMMTLRNAGTDHRKFMRMIAVYLDITAPLYWWKEFDTYKVGTVADSCSTMHKIHAKEFTLDDFSREHLISFSKSLDIWRENHDLDPKIYDDDPAKYQEDAYEIWSFAPLDILCVIIKGLNRYRELYLKTKDKKYWWQMIQLLPSSYNQKRTVMLNYEVLANMFAARCNHKLDEWKQLCAWMRTLPYSELITGECTPPSTKNTSRVVRHAYIRSIVEGFPEDGPYLRMYTRGYEDGKPGLGAENTIDAALLIDPDDIPFEKGTLVKVTIEEEEK